MTSHPGTPSDAELGRWVHDGLTFAQITAEWARRTGQHVARGSVGGALIQVALRGPTRPRFYDCIPWRLRPEHAGVYPAHMLRSLGIRRTGFPLHDGRRARLDGWLEMLERERVIVAYCPEHEDGLLYVDEELRAGPNGEIPIRVREIRWNEVDGARELGEM